MLVDMASGSLGGPEDIRTAWQLLAGGAPTAANALVDIAENGKSEVARVQAATAILDRVGLATPKERPQIAFAVIPSEMQEVGIGAQKLDPAEVVRARLKELAAIGPAPQPAPSQPDWQEAPVDAELVPMPGEDDDGDWAPSLPWG